MVGAGAIFKQYLFHVIWCKVYDSRCAGFGVEDLLRGLAWAEGIDPWLHANMDDVRFVNVAHYLPRKSKFFRDREWDIYQTDGNAEAAEAFYVNRYDGLPDTIGVVVILQRMF